MTEQTARLQQAPSKLELKSVKQNIPIWRKKIRTSHFLAPLYGACHLIENRCEIRPLQRFGRHLVNARCVPSFLLETTDTIMNIFGLRFFPSISNIVAD